MTPPRRRLAFGLLAALASTLLCLAGVEVLVRLAWDNLPDGIYPNDTGCCSRGTLIPGIEGHDRYHAFRHDSLGYRGPDRQPGKVEGLRVAVVGDSFVYGVGVADEEAIPALLEARLRRTEPSVEVINAGVPGANLETDLQRVAQVVRDYRPDIVVVVLLYNDLDTPVAGPGGPQAPPLQASPVGAQATRDWRGRLGEWMLPSMDPSQGRQQVVSPDVERRYALARAWRTWTYAALELQRVGTHYAESDRELTLLHVDSRQLDELAWQRTDQGLAELAALARREGVHLGLVFFQYGPLEGLPALTLYERTRASGLPVLDLDPLWGGYEQFVREYSFRFDLHPNRRANRMAAEAIEAWLAEQGWLSTPAEGERAAWLAAHRQREEAWLHGQRALAEEQRARLAAVQEGFLASLSGGELLARTDQRLHGWWASQPGDAPGAARMGERAGFMLRAGPGGGARLEVRGRPVDPTAALPLSLGLSCDGQPLGEPAPPTSSDFTLSLPLPAPVPAGTVVECELKASGVVQPRLQPGQPTRPPSSFQISHLALVP